MMKTSTVAAISTPRGRGGVALIRISGDEALEIACKCFDSVKTPEPRVAVYGKIKSGAEFIDDGVLIWFKAPHSYTGEDVVEITCHGGVCVTSAVLEAVFAAGAEAAGPGEFTRRAFVNGKLTLSRAQAVGNLIDAYTTSQRRLAANGMSGRLSRGINAQCERLVSLLASVYAVIDYPDEELPETDRNKMSAEIDSVSGGISALMSTYKTGKAICDGVRCVICGKPNVGKSTLYNLILGEDRAIVTDIPGTTRDVLEGKAELGGVTLILSDTAGIRESEDKIEEIGVGRSRDEIARSELLICVFDLSEREGETDAELLSCADGKTCVAVLNKCDGERKMSNGFAGKIKKAFSKTLEVSAKASPDKAREALSGAVSELFGSDKIDVSCDAVVCDARQFASLSRAKEYLLGASDALLSGEYPDIICTEVESALGELRMLDGDRICGEIVDEIFSKFCVGK